MGQCNHKGLYEDLSAEVCVGRRKQGGVREEGAGTGREAESPLRLL